MCSCLLGYSSLCSLYRSAIYKLYVLKLLDKRVDIRYTFTGANDVVGGLHQSLPVDLTLAASFAFLADLPLFSLRVEQPTVQLPPGFDYKVLLMAAGMREQAWGAVPGKGIIHTERKHGEK